MRSSPLTPLHESLYSLLHAAITSLLRHSSDLNLLKNHLKWTEMYTHILGEDYENQKYQCKKIFHVAYPQTRKTNKFNLF